MEYNNMKITHYNKGYIQKADCVIKGTIYMTQTEWQDAKKYLKSRWKRLTPYFYNSMLKKIGTGYQYGRMATVFYPGITITEVLAKRYSLKTKAINYQIVTTK